MKKKLTAIIVGALAVALVAGTWAFYTSTNSVDNKLKTQKYGDVLKETFTPDEDWQPGEEVDKIAGVKNTGDYNLVVRVKLDEKWTLADGTEKTISSVGTDITTYQQESATDGKVPVANTTEKSVVEKTLAASGWTKNNADGYWYYNTQLASGATANFMTKIKLKDDTDMGKYKTTNYYHEGTSEPTFEPGETGDTGVATTGWAVYTGAVPKPATATNNIYVRSISKFDQENNKDLAGYAGATYDLTITSETCQATDAAVTATWTTVPAAVKSGWNLE